MIFIKLNYINRLYDSSKFFRGNAQKSLYKVKSTMCNCGVTNLADLRRDAKMTLVSATSIVEGGYHDVTLKTAQQPNS